MIRFFWLFFFLLLTSKFCHASENQRAIWVVRHALNSSEDINNVIDVSERLNITDIYVQVRALGENYNTPLYKAEITNRFISLIKNARLRNIKVHAWLNVLYIWTGNSEPENINHIYHKAQNSILRTAVDDKIPLYAKLKSEGIEGYFISPQDSTNFREIKVFISDLINKFQVDGIHLDYFRYPDIKYSISPLSRTEFMLQNYIDPINIYADVTSFARMRGFQTFVYIDEMYREFLRNSLNMMLSQIKYHMQTINDKTELSIAVKPDLIQARHRYFQDWGFWLQNNLCDKVVLMNYTTDYDAFKQNIRLAQSLDVNDRIIIGISTYNQNEGALRQRVKLVQNMDFAGYALFSYNYLNENKKYLDNIVFADRIGGNNGENNSGSKGN